MISTGTLLLLAVAGLMLAQPPTPTAAQFALPDTAESDVTIGQQNDTLSRSRVGREVRMKKKRVVRDVRADERTKGRKRQREVRAATPIELEKRRVELETMRERAERERVAGRMSPREYRRIMRDYEAGIQQYRTAMEEANGRR